MDSGTDMVPACGLVLRIGMTTSSYLLNGQ